MGADGSMRGLGLPDPATTLRDPKSTANRLRTETQELAKRQVVGQDVAPLVIRSDADAAERQVAAEPVRVPVRQVHGAPPQERADHHLARMLPGRVLIEQRGGRTGFGRVDGHGGARNRVRVRGDLLRGGSGSAGVRVAVAA